MFYKYVSTHFSAKILTVRSDNALEFSDQACTMFYAKEEIIHQTSSPYRPKQNVRMERKHRHILKIARVLKFQSSLTNSYWDECVLTAASIINILPSVVLDYKIPYEAMTRTLHSIKGIWMLGFWCYNLGSEFRQCQPDVSLASLLVIHLFRRDLDC